MATDHHFLPPDNDGHRKHDRDRPARPAAPHSIDLRTGGIIFGSVFVSLGGILGAMELTARHTRAAIDGELKAIHVQLASQGERQERFESAVRYQFGKVDERFNKIDERLDKVDARLDKVDARLDKVDARLDKVDARLENIENRMDRMEDRQERGMARLEGKLDKLAEHMGMDGGPRRPSSARPPKS
ncbi:hypothetical protein [Cupriavidus campinensis]